MRQTRNSSLLGKITVLVVICCCCLPAQAKYGGGTGEPNDPYLIYTAEQMNTIGANANDWDKHFLLCADIDLSAYTGTSFNIIGTDNNKPFGGVFDGNGHTISNFTYNSTETYYIGLFVYVEGPDSEIKNLGLIEPNVHAGTGSVVGSLVGNLGDGTISNCYTIDGSVTGYYYIGGLAGVNYSGSILNCYFTGDVSGDGCVGGLAAYNYGSVSKCYSTGNVSGDYEVGGLVGINCPSTISNCYSTASVSGDNTLGGLVGYNHSGTITNSYSTGGVSGRIYIGGLLGYNYFGTILNCYSAGSVKGYQSLGGLVGCNIRGDIVNSFWDIETSGQKTSDGGTGLPTPEMQTMSTFTDAGWDFENVWWILEGIGYPRLLWENKYGGGTGESNDPYLIYTAEQMNTICAYPCDWGKHFKLMADIDLSAFTGTQFNIIGTWDTPFTGVFDGNGHLIFNFAYQANKANVGLFGHVGDPNARVQDLTLIDPKVNGVTGARIGAVVGYLSYGTISYCGVEGGSVSGRQGIGGLVGENRSGAISNCHATTSVMGTSYSTGGLVGVNRYGVTLDCYTAGSVEGEDYTGGLVGQNGGPISNCYALGNISGDDSTGGLVGSHINGTILNSYASGNVSGADCIGGLVGNSHALLSCCYAAGHVEGGNYIGGLVGYKYESSILDCFARGTVKGNNYNGGLAGAIIRSQVSNCYATGTVDGEDSIGGLIGWNELSTVSNCYAAGFVNAVGVYTGGLIGTGLGIVSGSYWDIQTSGQSNSAGGRGKTTVQMHSASTFISWGGCGVEVWTINDGMDYPRLLWENEGGKLITAQELSDFLIGDGSEGTPYLIGTADELNLIGLFYYEQDKHFKLIADIDLAAFSGTQFNNIPLFSGVFNGNGFTISNFSYESNGGYVGLFGYVNGSSATIKNLNLIEPYVDGGFSGSVGSLVGWLREGKVVDCYIYNCSVSGSYRYTGGLTGINEGTISNCSTIGSISGNYYTGGGDYYTGGLVGRNDGTILHCNVTASVQGNENGYIGAYEYFTGGLVGLNTEEGMISNCYARGSVTGFDRYTGGLVGYSWGGMIFYCGVTGNINGKNCTGGLVGRSYSTRISNCYATGDVFGNESVGGLVGRSWYGVLLNCYATGGVSGDDSVGGLVGSNYNSDVINAFWDIETSGQTTSEGGTGLTTADMQTMSTFTNAGWDFVGEAVNGIEDIWFIPQQDYPHLWWEGIQVPMKLTPHTLNCRSEGNWVKAHITLPQGFTVADVNSDRPAVLHSFGFQSTPLYVFVNKDKVVEIEAAFERQAVCSLAGNWPDELTVAGFLADGNVYLGTSNVRINHPGMKVIEDLANYWLNADCVHPTWCDGIDMNRDSLVNLLDYALLMNINVEFVSNE
jgi:hypothetical protein